MRVQCDTCEGYGQVISERSLRQGHTHSNDPDREDVECEDCDGEGTVPATAADLDGEHVRYRYVTGYAFIMGGALAVESENGLLVVNLQPDDLEILS